MGDRARKDSLFDGFAEVAKAMANGRRAELIDVLAQGERHVEELAAEIGQTVANTSFHLRVLAGAGLVATRRDGTRIYYRLASDRVGELWAALRDVAAAHHGEIDALAHAYLGRRDQLDEISREELAARIDSGELIVVDVRPGAEYAAGHITGARSIPAERPRAASSPRCPTTWKSSPTAAGRTASSPTTRYGSSGVAAARPAGSRTDSRNGATPAFPSRYPRPRRWREAHRDRRSAAMAIEQLVDPEQLRAQVRDKYREVATDPHRSFHFHTGRPLAARLGYEPAAVDALPDRAVESFAGVGNPFSLRRLVPGERVVDVGSGAGFDSFIAAGQVGASGAVVGIDMTAEMLEKSTDTAAELGLHNVEFRHGFAEELPIETGWADVVVSNGVINLCADKRAVVDEIRHVLRPGGWLQFADIANGRPVPPEALRDIDLWTG